MRSAIRREEGKVGRWYIQASSSNQGFPPWVGCREKESALKREFPPFPGTSPSPPLLVLWAGLDYILVLFVFVAVLLLHPLVLVLGS